MGPRTLWKLAKFSTNEQIRFYFVNIFCKRKKPKWLMGKIK